jgi:hypothetical protein
MTPMDETLKIDIYSICWNEADMLGFFFKQYDPIASRYIFFDDGSSDGSLDILKAHPKVEIRPFPRLVEDSYVLSAQLLHDSIWKESRGKADWVILTAVDEHLVHPDLPDYLARCQNAGVTAIPALGYQMISDDFPGPDGVLSEAITHGAPFAKMSKLNIFQPDAISETLYSVGRHTAKPVGRVVTPLVDEVLNLHFKYLDFDRLRDRHKLLASGLGARDVKKGWGHRYWFDEQRLKEDWTGFKEAAVNLREQGVNAPSLHNEPRWWQENGSNYPRVKDCSDVITRKNPFEFTA